MLCSRYSATSHVIAPSDLHRILRSKSKGARTSLAIQRLRFYLPVQGVRVWSLVRELRSHMPPGQKKKKKPNRKQKQHCNKFNKYFKSGPHQKKLKKKRVNGKLNSQIQENCDSRPNPYHCRRAKTLKAEKEMLSFPSSHCCSTQGNISYEEGI